ncbi:MAG: hypothetical protein QGG67_10560 [Gammaproteobacteria bacterium]|jgi:hypothetical protein|nr:hypothetical protein [Gammaproteobacteria bacterium]MDP6096409.1 hypothetical protein [Gammaproteobacteria bacterium]|tara:strand:- start:4903 stop:5748 length:846 start_codon:yes stop_codon:yes gene_type:complete
MLFVARIIPNEGLVEYRNLNGDWAIISDTMYLVNGNAIRTSSASSATIEITGETYSSRLDENSEIEVSDNLVHLTEGEFVNSRIVAANIMSRILDKLNAALSFVTVRRQGPCDPVVRTASNLSLSSDYPDLVWQNACANLLYRLTIDEEIYDIPNIGDEEIVRFSVTDIALGSHNYRVEIVEEDNVIYSPRSDSSFDWIDENSAVEMRNEIARFDSDSLAQSDYLEESGFLVEAMYKYRDYIESHSEQNYLRPLLIRAYAELGLYSLQSQEARLYNSLRNN